MSISLSAFSISSVFIFSISLPTHLPQNFFYPLYLSICLSISIYIYLFHMGSSTYNFFSNISFHLFSRSLLLAFSISLPKHIQAGLFQSSQNIFFPLSLSFIVYLQLFLKSPSLFVSFIIDSFSFFLLFLFSLFILSLSFSVVFAFSIFDCFCRAAANRETPIPSKSKQNTIRVETIERTNFRFLDRDQSTLWEDAESRFDPWRRKDPLLFDMKERLLTSLFRLSV